MQCFQKLEETTKVYEQCDRPSSKDEDNGVEDEDVDIMKGLGSATNEYAESPFDSDNKEYDFQDNQKQRKVSQVEEDFTINKWRSLKSLKPQKMHLNHWLDIHFEKGFYIAENKQKNDIRASESKE